MSGIYYASLTDINHCKEVCDSISNRLCEIDSLIEYIETNSSDLIDADIRSIISELESTKRSLLDEVGNVKRQIRDGMERRVLNELKTEASALLKHSSEVASVRIMALKRAVQDSLNSSIEENKKNIGKAVAGGAVGRADINKILNDVDNNYIRNMVKLMARNPKYNNLSTEQLLNDAYEALKPENVPKDIINKVRNDIEKRLVSENIDSKQVVETMSRINQDITLPEMETIAEEVIISEKLRKRAVKAIVENITDKGFVVNRKNIKTLKETNTVRILASKPGGQKAEFNVNLDGSFIYKFDDYLGQACQRDIQPFLEDLESIYGIQVHDIKEIWSNPDKESSQKYQTYNVNKGGN